MTLDFSVDLEVDARLASIGIEVPVSLIRIGKDSLRLYIASDAEIRPTEFTQIQGMGLCGNG
ncbi:hypothetical protein [Billgrantia tianxiuensis]|uniref:hypothetical protein n=1 Tax=Billgrantia tianxiuensis TaxID=2497861 RepID=UPI001F1B34C2|nr:hypothetical protein [Halomonas tianxiuensis]